MDQWTYLEHAAVFVQSYWQVFLDYDLIYDLIYVCLYIVCVSKWLFAVCARTFFIYSYLTLFQSIHLQQLKIQIKSPMDK